MCKIICVLCLTRTDFSALMSPKGGGTMHSRTPIEGYEKKTCEYCHGDFYFKRSHLAQEAGRFCSRVCFRAWQKENKGKIRYINSGLRKHNPNVELHRKYALQWQRENRDKVRAQSVAKLHRDEVIVLYECPCDHPKKHMHHFDYELPFCVFKLCPKCHSAEHARLRALQKEAI